MRIFPEQGATSDSIGVYIEADGAKGEQLRLDAFDGQVCGVGEGSGACDAQTDYALTKDPQTLAVVFTLPDTGQSGLLTATLLDGGSVVTSSWRRISRAAPPPVDAPPVDAALDAGVD